MRLVELDDHLTVPSAALALVSFDEGEVGADGGRAAWLAPAETVYARALATPRRRASWLAGRFAAKSAIGALSRSRTPLDRIEILPAASGAPLVRHEGPALAVSISHTRGLAAAVAFDRDRAGALGIDVEVSDQDIDPALVDLAFVAEEAGALAAGPDNGARHASTLRFWTAKEAALKAVGRGLRLSLAAVRLEWTGEVPRPSRAVVECSPGLSVPFEIVALEHPGHVLSLARESTYAG